jgi:hypothetical protein
MTRYKRRISVSVVGLLLSAGASAHAQVASLGQGWLLDSGGSITSVPGEVISGRNSIKASGTSRGTSLFFLQTDPTLVRFLPSQSYTMTWSYRIITASDGGFAYGFESSEGNGVGDFGPNNVLRGASGSSGTVTTTFTLRNHGDYRVEFAIAGTGSIVIDDIRITDANGQLVASENAEGPSLTPNPLNFQVTDAIALFTPAQASERSVAAKDLDGDSYPETILTLTAPRPSTTPLEPIVIEASGRMRLATADFFPAGAPTVKHSPVTLFADINNDGLTDILFADAGSDAPPFTGSRIGVALNVGGGKYRDVSSLIPADQQTSRSYAIAVGDIFGDGRVEIILPDQNHGTNTALLRWNGNGFDEIRNWIPQSIWSAAPSLLNFSSAMSLEDFDRDGRLDLLVTGQQNNPNFQIVFGGPGGFTAGTLLVLPDGPFGHTQGGPQPNGTLTTAEVSPVVVADFNNDGLPDIFSGIRNITLFANGSFLVGDMTYVVRLNQGSRRFIDATPSPYVNLGRVQYQNLMTVDMNNDGFLDVVGMYSTDPPPGTSPQWGTSLFLNDGTGAFQIVDGAQFIGATTAPPNGNRWGLGSFVPTVVSPGRTEGIVYQSVGGCGTAGCPAVGLNLFKVVANGALGTGPNFVDPATLGVPGFNEFYYLRHYPDAAAAVQAGQYASGLAHYLAVGKARGYRPSAASTGAPTNLTATVVGSSVTLSWTAPLNAAVTSYLLEAGSAPGLSDLVRFPTGSTANSFSTSGVASGTYYVRVKTISGTATSGPSNEVVVTVGSGSCTVAPAAPTGLVSSVAGSTVSLRWSASGGSPQSYVLEVGSSPGLADLARLDLGQPATTFTAANAASGTYYVRVRATNACGTSNPSNEILIVVP